jgi:hypothetical protein
MAVLSLHKSRETEEDYKNLRIASVPVIGNKDV